ncbi:MAG: hypothetical protein HYX87_01320 [Chloroflexi bacterium]|nr:hypothetical protein [Chloroflexota bacterium]
MVPQSTTFPSFLAASSRCSCWLGFGAAEVIGGAVVVAFGVEDTADVVVALGVEEAVDEEALVVVLELGVVDLPQAATSDKTANMEIRINAIFLDIAFPLMSRILEAAQATHWNQNKRRVVFSIEKVFEKSIAYVSTQNKRPFPHLPISLGR